MGLTEQQALNRIKRFVDYNETHVGHLNLVMNQNEPIKDDDGLVKNMNFGVLDWGRLENWKSNEKQIPPRFIKKKIQQTPDGSPRGLGLPPRVRWPRGTPVEPRIYESYRCSNDQVELVDSLKGGQIDEMVTENETLLSADVKDPPHSCPFPLPLGADVEWPNETPVTPLRGRSLNEHSMDSKKHDLDLYEHPALKCKQPSSPNRRFGFSIGKMARSFSLKESPTVPVNSRESLDSVNHNWKKPNATNPSRSSPLRRFLDPLLKPKGVHLAEKVHKSKLEPSAGIAHLNENEPLQSKKHRSSNVQALLQLTLKNGIPFFKLAVESSSDLLAAAVRKLPSGKNDTSLIYAFYSVHETKKKSGGWIYQSSKEKGYCFEYNIVGQMKITSSYHAEFIGPDKGLYVVRESVLYTTENETKRADHKALDCMLEGELAAIIVKNSSDETCGDIGSFKTTTVVLPDRVHSWPNSGSRSPLINRWKSGGSCDCGGWDIGCLFHVLKTSTTPSTSDHLDLCYQVGYKNKCSFRLVSVNDGLYSLEYDPSMSLLQAFSICVAVVSSQKLTHIFEVNYVPESKDLSKPIPTDNEKVKSRVSKPPASPVARV